MFDYCYNQTSVLTKLEFQLKTMVVVETLVKN